MQDTKPAIASASIWGVILVGISTMLSLFGVQVPGLNDPQLALDLSTLVGAALALWGRMRPQIKAISGLVFKK